jgi:7-carboxy-7-deazaguanine synthase
MLTVTEIFRSIQGESTWAGLPCTFVRLTGCNLRCNYCDTAYAYEHGAQMTLPQVVTRVRELGMDLVEVTGGEPLAQEAVPELLAALAEISTVVLVETNGSLPLPPRRRWHAILDVKCPGSGMAAHMHWGNLEKLQPRDEVKFVVGDRADFDYAVQKIRHHGLEKRGLPLLFSPVAGRLPPAELAMWILETKLPLRLQLQMHKIIWPDKDRGV